MSKRREKVKQSKGQRLAETADRHVLYGEAVQAPEAEIDFIDDTFKEIRGRKATTIREDFGGTGNTSAEWVRRRAGNKAICVDIDPEVLEWGRENNTAALPVNQQPDLQFVEADCLTVETEKVDAVLAMNFSYWLFRTRDDLRTYFERVRESLVDDGVLFLDAYGGWEAHEVGEEERDCGEFTYIWETVEFDPISNRMACAIHFRLSDGSKIRNAFTYEWRFWSLPEIRELLEEAGFSNIRFFWEDADDDGEGNGEFEEVVEAETDPGWICYIVAEK